MVRKFTAWSHTSHTCEYQERSASRRTKIGRPIQATAQRLRSGIALFAPDVFEREDLEELILKVQAGTGSHHPGQLQDGFPGAITRLVCSKKCHGGQIKSFKGRDDPMLKAIISTTAKNRQFGRLDATRWHEKVDVTDSNLSKNEAPTEKSLEISDDEYNELEKEYAYLYDCEFNHLNSLLKDLAARLLLCAYLEPAAQSLLRNVGPDSSLDLKTDEFLEVHRALAIERDPPAQDQAKTLCTHKLVHIVAQSLAGRTFPDPGSMVLAMAAGGAVVGLNTNDNQPLESDPGHCLYIVPGSIECPTRRMRVIFEQSPELKNTLPSIDPGRSLEETLRPIDTFGEVRVGHTIAMQGDTAKVKTQLFLGAKIMRLNNLLVIDKACRVDIQWDCFNNCVEGRLGEDEIRRIDLVQRFQ